MGLFGKKEEEYIKKVREVLEANLRASDLEFCQALDIRRNAHFSKDHGGISQLEADWSDKRKDEARKNLARNLRALADRIEKNTL